MESPIITREKVDVEISTEIMAFGFKVGAASCGLIGLWAACCLVAALISSGPIQMARGYITAITGF